MKKFLPYILILVALVGLFSPVGKVSAQAATGACFNYRGERVTIANINSEATCTGTNAPIRNTNFNACVANSAVVPGKTTFSIQNCAEYFQVNYWMADVAPTPNNPNPGTVPCTDTDPATGARTPEGCTPTPTPPPKAAGSEFENNIDMGCAGLWNSSFSGCFMKLIYWIFHDIPAFMLWLCAYFFNVLISITLSSALFAKSVFMQEAWGIVRDLSNIFFILILIYISVKIILDIGGSEAKKMIARVVIMALLINFSMFFTEVVIDTSNILALIFYNKINTTTTADGKPINYDSVTGEKDVAGGMVSGFDPTKKLEKPFFDKAKEQWVNGIHVQPDAAQVPFGIMLSVTLVSGLVMGFAAYALFVSGLSFIGRLIELWALIIFSPFAFMSWSIPEFEKLEYLGWSAWFHRLIKTSFMAPIFMFFLYFIFKLVGAKIFDNMVTPTGGAGAAGMATMLLLVLLPALTIMFLLLKATEFAKKGSGKFGEMAIKAGSMVAGVAGGLALGAATGGTALALRGTVGRAATNLSESNAMRNWAARSKFGAGVTRLTSRAAAGTYDARNAPGVGALAKAGGINLEATKAITGGKRESFGKNRAARVKREEEFANKQLDTSDYGKAQLTRGNMGARRAENVKQQLIKGGMLEADAEARKVSMMDAGITLSDVSSVSRYLNAARREEYANRIERRDGGIGLGDGTLTTRTRAKRWRASRRISANKIRLPADNAKKKAERADMIAAIVEAGGIPPTATPPAGGGGGGAGAGGTPHP